MDSQLLRFSAPLLYIVEKNVLLWNTCQSVGRLTEKV